MKTVSTESISPWLQMLWDQGGSDLLLTGGSAPRLRVDGKLRPIAGCGRDVRPGGRRDRSQPAGPASGRDLRGAPGRRLLVLVAGQGAAQGERVHAEGPDRAGPSHDPDPDSELRRAGFAADGELAGHAAPRPRAGDGPDRFREVDDPGLHHRPHQLHTLAAHPHHRGSDRVHPQPQGVGSDPAGDRAR